MVLLIAPNKLNSVIIEINFKLKCIIEFTFSNCYIYADIIIY